MRGSAWNSDSWSLIIRKECFFSYEWIGQKLQRVEMGQKLLLFQLSLSNQYMVFTCIRSCLEQKPLYTSVEIWSTPFGIYRFKNSSKDEQVGCLLLIHKFPTFSLYPQPLRLFLTYKTHPTADHSSYTLFFFSLIFKIWAFQDWNNLIKDWILKDNICSNHQFYCQPLHFLSCSS